MVRNTNNNFGAPYFRCLMFIKCHQSISHNHLTLLDRASVAILQLANSISHNIASVLVCFFVSDCTWCDVFPFCLLHYCSVLLHVYTYCSFHCKFHCSVAYIGELVDTLYPSIVLNISKIMNKWSRRLRNSLE